MPWSPGNGCRSLLSPCQIASGMAFGKASQVRPVPLFPKLAAIRAEQPAPALSCLYGWGTALTAAQLLEEP
jgi:hypothetical protein